MRKSSFRKYCRIFFGKALAKFMRYTKETESHLSFDLNIAKKLFVEFENAKITRWYVHQEAKSSVLLVLREIQGNLGFQISFQFSAFSQ